MVGISTDKACKPVNVMGMTKAVMERILVEANLRQPATRFACVRYGNVVASRGSVVPLFLEQIARGGPVTVTLKEMTRFLLTLDRAVDTVLAAAAPRRRRAKSMCPRCPPPAWWTWPRCSSATATFPIVYTGIRPGREDPRDHGLGGGMPPHHRAQRLLRRLPDAARVRARIGSAGGVMSSEYSSADITLDRDGLRAMLAPYLSAPLPAELNA